MPAVFSDHMVLQAGVPVPVWGWAEAGEGVTVTIAGQEKDAEADENGKWRVVLDPLKTSVLPLAMAIEGADTNDAVRIADILVGQVWLGAGQSNMKMAGAGCENAASEIAAARYPRIRLFSVGQNATNAPAENVRGEWKHCTPDTVKGFSATSYFFGRELHRELKCPVGLIASAWGGTAVEAWTPLDVQTNQPALQPVLTPWDERIAAYQPEAVQTAHEEKLEAWRKAAFQSKQANKKPPRRPRAPVAPALDPNRPSNLYNGMIHPLVPFAMKGAIWYQGERNTRGPAAALYGLQLETLIKSWRSAWGAGDFPFVYVQLPNYETTRNWSVVQEQMLKTLAVPNSGMAITIDVGDAKNIHPKNKQAVGKRLALWALARTYDKRMPYSGPLFRRCERLGDKLVVTFDHADGGLRTPTGSAFPIGFEIAGEDKRFMAAKAEIMGDAVMLTNPGIREPVAVRYAWAANPNCNLFNAAGLPASPFRSDDWELELTE